MQVIKAGFHTWQSRWRLCALKPDREVAPGCWTALSGRSGLDLELPRRLIQSVCDEIAWADHAQLHDGSLIPGPFTLDTRREILDALLALQEKMCKILIDPEEVERIRTLLDGVKQDGRSCCRSSLHNTLQPAYNAAATINAS